MLIGVAILTASGLRTVKSTLTRINSGRLNVGHDLLLQAREVKHRTPIPRIIR